MSFTIVFGFMVEKLDFVGFDWNSVSLGGMFGKFGDFMAFDEMELRVVKIGGGESAFEVIEVKRGGEVGMDWIEWESAADLELTVGIGVIFLLGFLGDSLNAGEVFE